MVSDGLDLPQFGPPSEGRLGLAEPPKEFVNQPVPVRGVPAAPTGGRGRVRGEEGPRTAAVSVVG